MAQMGQMQQRRLIPMGSGRKLQFSEPPHQIGQDDSNESKKKLSIPTWLIILIRRKFI
jgi:hypothetical protein